jgi:thermitase
MNPRYCLACSCLLLLALIGALGASPTQGQKDVRTVPGRVLVKFENGKAEAQISQLIEFMQAKPVGRIPGIDVRVLQFGQGISEVAAARALGGRPDVVFAEPDVIMPPAAEPNDPYYGSEWHLPKIAAPSAWDNTTGAGSVTIAILDTGCDPSHPDLAAKYVPGWNFYDGNGDTSDVYGHGTAVAGCAAALSNNAVGVASVAWGCRILPIRISDPNGYAYYSTIASALTWAADQGARVANVSYACSDSSTVAAAAQYFQSKGGVVAAAAGNDSTFDSHADNPYVLTVSATDSNDALASWSNTGNNIDLAAPGVSIRTTNRGSGYGTWSGTSFSAPIVAGTAALVISANPALSGAAVQDLLEQSADDRGADGWDAQFGWGRVNAWRAVTLALGAGGGDSEPPTASFGSPANGETVSGTVVVQVEASDNLGMASVSLYVDGQLAGTDSNVPYSFLWDTLDAAEGAHTLKAVASDDAGNTGEAQISVTVHNQAADTTPPTVAITSPADGAQVGGSVSVTVDTSDDVGVVRVELYVNGALVSSSNASPFKTSWNARKAAPGAYTLQCKAYDAAGNAGLSQPITVSVPSGGSGGKGGSGGNGGKGGKPR